MSYPNQGGYGNNQGGNGGGQWNQQPQQNQWGGQQPANQWGGQQPGQWNAQQPPNQYGGQWGTQPNQHRPQQQAWGAQQLGQYGSQTINQYDKQFTGDPRDTQLRQLVDTLFAKYDRDRSLTLDRKELVPVFNEALTTFNMGFTLSQNEVEALLLQIDINRDQKIGKPELYNCLKSLVLNETSGPGSR
jgi:hypothetical protein